ncbi:MAG: hypothetical protein RIR97_50 [Pseudomonadota bacterium]
MMQKPNMFEDFAIGLTFTSQPRKVLAEEIIAFASEFDPQPMHLSEDGGKASILGGLAASGWHTSAIMMRLMFETFLKETAAEGSPGLDYLDWRKPVLAGDELTLKSTVLSTKRLNSKPGLGMVTFRHEVSNQKGDIVLQTENPAMVRMRHPEKG